MHFFLTKSLVSVNAIPSNFLYRLSIFCAKCPFPTISEMNLSLRIFAYMAIMQIRHESNKVEMKIIYLLTHTLPKVQALFP